MIETYSVSFFIDLSIILYIITLYMYKTKNNKKMRSITICYALMLVMCIIVGAIVALMIKCSPWWGFLFVCPIVWALIPQRELRNKIKIYPEFSSAFLVVAFAVLAVAWVSVMLQIKFDTFISIMYEISISAAFVMTIAFIMLIPKNHSKTWLCTL